MKIKFVEKLYVKSKMGALATCYLFLNMENGNLKIVNQKACNCWRSKKYVMFKTENDSLR